jgi:hypothetical protein
MRSDRRSKKSVWIDHTIHARLYARVLRKKLAAVEEGGHKPIQSLGGLVDQILSEWLDRQPKFDT